MMYFGRGFLPSTSFVSLLLLLSIAAPNCVNAEWCKSMQYNPDVFDETPIQPFFEDRDCYVDDCIAYICKANATVYFGRACWDDMVDFCLAGGNILFDVEFTDEYTDLLALYRKYMEEVKPFGNDSLQERLFWVEAEAEVDKRTIGRFGRDWSEKASAYLSTNLQSFMEEIRNSEINVKEKWEEKAKVTLIQSEFLLHDIQDVQNVANQSLPESEYFQRKFAEMKVIKQNDNIFKSYMIKSNNVETEMNNTQNEINQSMDALNVDSEFESCQIIQDKIFQTVISAKEKILDLLKFADETIEKVSLVADDEISYIQSAGYEARKAMKDYENEREMKDLFKEVKVAVEDVKKIGEAAQKSADKAQSIADKSKMIAENAEKTAATAKEIANESNLTATNAEKSADKAQVIADESKMTAENAGKIAEDAKKVADSAGENSEASNKLLAEALHSNGRKIGGFEGAFVLFFMVLIYVL